MRRDRLIFVLFGFIYLLTLKYHRKSAIIYLILKIFTFRIVGLLHTSFNYNIVLPTASRAYAEHMPKLIINHYRYFKRGAPRLVNMKSEKG